MLDAPPYQLVEGGAPRTRHAWRTWGAKRWHLLMSLLFQSEQLMEKNLLFTDNVWENEVPAGEEGPDFPYSYVGVEISRTRLGDARAELRVAQAS